jgi:hypothetical protein
MISASADSRSNDSVGLPTFGSTAWYSGIPRTLSIFRSNTPLVAVARYGAIGESSDQRHVVLPPVVLFDRRRPLPIAVMPSGTVISKSYVALSRGLSLDGYQPGEPCGSLTTNAPSSVGTHPSSDSSGSSTGSGFPA